MINPNAYRVLARLMLAAGLAAVSAAPGPCLAAGERGESLYLAHRCDGCHGRCGLYPTIELYPRLGGQNAAYLYQQMRDIRDGRRDNAMSAAMRSTVSPTTDEELRAIADWLADQ